MKESHILELRKIIQDRVPQDYIKVDENHEYKIPSLDLTFKSVTTKLRILHNPFFENWRLNRAMEYLEEWHKQINEENRKKIFEEAKEYPEILFKTAGGRGTQIHALIDSYLIRKIKTDSENLDIISLVDGTSGARETDYSVWSALRSFSSWERTSGYIPLASELKVWSIGYQVAGTIDNIGVIDNDITIVDIKTSNAFQDDYHLQVGGYYGLFTALTKLKVKKCLVLKLDKEQGMAETEEVDSPRKRFNDFIRVSKLYDSLQELKEYRRTSRRKTIKI